MALATSAVRRVTSVQLFSNDAKTGHKESEAMPNLIGILGGMGPAATVDLMQKIVASTPAARDQDHAPVVVWNVPQIPDRPSAVFGGEPSPFPYMLKGALQLQACGATAIAMPCNTAHFWADGLQAELKVPFLHIADAVLEKLEVHGRPSKIALLSTAATVHAGFYQSRFAAHGVQTIVPAKTQIEEIYAAIKLVKGGRIPAARERFLPVARELHDQGADALLLACTELPLLTPGWAFEAQCIDPTQALAEACVRHAFNTRIEASRFGDQMA
jgi:aspartate racemase